MSEAVPLNSSQSSTSSEETSSEDESQSGSEMGTTTEEEYEENIPLIDLGGSELETSNPTLPPEPISGEAEGELRKVGPSSGAGEALRIGAEQKSKHQQLLTQSSSRMADVNSLREELNISDELEIDLYGDLDPFVFHRSDEPERKSHQELIDRVKEVETLLVEAYDKMAKMHSKFKTLSKTHQTVLKNASSLLETAHGQIEQKNHALSHFQKKLQLFNKQFSNPSDPAHKDLKEMIAKLNTENTMPSPVSTLSVRELCDQALSKFKNEGEGDQSMPRETPNHWKKRFHCDNVSYYFYSHNEKFGRRNSVTEFEFVEDDRKIPTATSSVAGDTSKKENVTDPKPTDRIKSKNSPPPEDRGRLSATGKEVKSKSRSPLIVSVKYTDRDYHRRKESDGSGSREGHIARKPGERDHYRDRSRSPRDRDYYRDISRERNKYPHRSRRADDRDERVGPPRKSRYQDKR